jgi:hypothetical protein
MTGQDEASTEPPRGNVHDPVPVTPSRGTERPAGLAFDVEKNADLPGVPVGDQAPHNPVTTSAQEKGSGVGLAVPANPAREDQQGGDHRAGERQTESPGYVEVRYDSERVKDGTSTGTNGELSVPGS